MLVSFTHVCSRSLSSGLVYDLLLRGCWGLSEYTLPEKHLFHNRDVHCLKDTWVAWCLSYPGSSGGAPRPFLGRCVSWWLGTLDCEDLVARGCMPANTHCELLLPAGRPRISVGNGPGPWQFLWSYVINQMHTIRLGRTLTLSLCLSQLLFVF